MTRSIKIESDGDYFKRKVFPKIRLRGQWLAAAGFPPESRVKVMQIAPGMLLLKANSSVGATH